MPLLVVIGVVLEAIALASFALLLLYSVPLLIRAARLFFGGVPLIGDWIANRIESGLTDVTTALHYAARDAIRALGVALFAVAVAPWWALYKVDQVLWKAVSALAAQRGAFLWYINDLYARISGAVTQAHDELAGFANWAVGDIEHVNGTLTAELSDLGASLEYNIEHVNGTLGAEIAGLGHWAAGQLAALNASLEAEIASVRDLATGGLSSAVATYKAELAQVAGQAEAAAQAAQAAAEQAAHAAAATAATGAVGALDQAAHDAVIGPWQGLLSEVGPIVADLPQEVAQALPGVAGLAGTLPVSVPGILGLVVPAIAAVGAEVERCVTPNCGLLGRLGQLDRTLSDAALWAALVALLSEAAHDPAGAAGDIIGGLAGPVEAVASAAGRLVGVG